MSESKTSSRTLVSAERRQRAVMLRRAGATYVEIGETLGVSAQAAHKAVMAALADSRRHCAEEADELRTLMVERLDAALKALWPKVARGDEKAINTMLRIETRRAQLLGLDLAAQHDDGLLLDQQALNLLVAAFCQIALHYVPPEQHQLFAGDMRRLDLEKAIEGEVVLEEVADDG